MYECVSEVLLHLGRMFGIVFTAQTAQIWPKKNLFAALFHFPMKVLEHGLLNMPSSSLSPKNNNAEFQF